MSGRRWTLWLPAWLLCAGASSGLAQQPSAAAVDAVLKPGDQLRVAVWRKPEYSGDFYVSGDGTLRHPLFQAVPVAGVPMAAVRERLRALLARYEANPEFVVEPLLRVAVAGEVRSPSLYSFAPEVTVAQAVALAGGATERGRLNKVQLVRDGRPRMLDLTRPGDAGALLTVRSGDQITVRRGRNVLGEFILPLSAVVAAVGTVVQIARNQ